LAEIACGNFSGHHFVARWQKAWFLPAALAGGRLRRFGGNFSGHRARPPAKKRGFCGGA
jgi:hypothetical protein